MAAGRNRKYVVRRARNIAGSALAAATLAVVTAFPALPAAAAPAADVAATATASSGRIEGIHADLERAVALHQVTAEQAYRFEQRLQARIAGEA
ncbi:MAG: hypothetical protein JWO93_1299 [Micrococcaceae bacterium]|jgi:hypothetical protein|nr:hypothetical protein [Micrococcaceae bacterium]